jgi:XRE family aerobic/anaerobic benzoate catabolism transcriptional regulator
MGLLEDLGGRVRELREQRGVTQRALAAKSGVSPRYLAQLEAGRANISVERLDDVARALGCSPAALLRPRAAQPRRPTPARPAVIALLGLRGAGKSTVGARLARRLGLRFVELDRAVEAAAGLSLAELFELHGEGYYRRLERETLIGLFAEPAGMVLATGGGLVTDRETYKLLKRRAVTVWLKARPEDHWNRVLQQGDQRPMAQHPHAMAELRALLVAREKLYAEADHVIETSKLAPDQVVQLLRHQLGAAR